MSLGMEIYKTDHIPCLLIVNWLLFIHTKLKLFHRYNLIPSIALSVECMVIIKLINFWLHKMSNWHSEVSFNCICTCTLLHTRRHRQTHTYTLRHAHTRRHAHTHACTHTCIEHRQTQTHTLRRDSH